jgi:hypothetical protein
MRFETIFPKKCCARALIHPEREREREREENINAHLSVFSGDFFVEFGLREVPERGADWCAHVIILLLCA